jgi:tRNA(fMet)-specific endonuclease VapC
MEPRFLLDTNICIYIRQKKPQEVLRRFDSLKMGEAAVSVITFGELIYGAEKSAQREAAMKLLRELSLALPVLSLPDTAADTYGSFRADLERRGAMIGNNDLWIASHAKASGMTLVTNNEREFRRLRGLKIENWIV